MIGTTAAIIASAVIGGGVSLMAASTQANSADKAVAAQTAASDKNIAYQEKVDAQNRADLAPWRDAGKKALAKLEAGIADGSFDPTKFEFKADPGYDFRMKQGEKAIARSAAARGNLFSGTTGAKLAEYGQDFASNEYDRAYSRAAAAKTTNYNALAAVAGTGQRAVESSNAQSQTGANIIIGQNTNAGNAIANGAMAQGKAWADGFNNIGAAANTGIENYLLYDMIG